MGSYGPLYDDQRRQLAFFLPAGAYLLGLTSRRPVSTPGCLGGRPLGEAHPETLCWRALCGAVPGIKVLRIMVKHGALFPCFKHDSGILPLMARLSTHSTLYKTRQYLLTRLLSASTSHLYSTLYKTLQYPLQYCTAPHPSVRYRPRIEGSCGASTSGAGPSPVHQQLGASGVPVRCSISIHGSVPSHDAQEWQEQLQPLRVEERNFNTLRRRTRSTRMMQGAYTRIVGKRGLLSRFLCHSGRQEFAFLL